MSDDPLDTQTTRKRFCIGLYRWACAEWERELAQDYSRLRTLRTRAADQFLAALQRIKPDDVLVVIAALTKRAHADALLLVGDKMTARERDRLADLDVYRHMWANKQGVQPSRLTLLARRRLVPLIQDQLQVLGEREKVDSFAEWRYLTRVDEYTVETYVDFGGRHDDLTYQQYVRVGSERVLPSAISLLGSLGISATKWRISGEQDARFAADQIAGLSRYFMDAISSITAMGE